jgi:hypothetical protein
MSVETTRLHASEPNALGVFFAERLNAATSRAWLSFTMPMQSLPCLAEALPPAATKFAPLLRSSSEQESPSNTTSSLPPSVRATSR